MGILELSTLHHGDVSFQFQNQLLYDNKKRVSQKLGPLRWRYVIKGFVAKTAPWNLSAFYPAKFFPQ